MQALGGVKHLAGAALLLSLGLAVTAGGVRPATAAGSSCRHVPLSPRPGWVGSGAWMENGTELIVADARARQVLSFDPQGRGFMAQPQKLIQSFERGSSPLRITSDSMGRNLFVELDRERLTVLDSNRAFPILRKNLLQESQTGQAAGVIDKLYLWAPVNMDLLSYAAIQEGPESYWEGFVRFPAANPSQFQKLDARNRDASRIYYRLGNPLVSSLGDTAYVLFLDGGSPGLYLNRKGSSELEPMDALDELYGSKSAPVLPSFVRPEDFPAVMRAVERSSMPVGLYGWSGSLYVLSRSPGKGGTNWVMAKVDPVQDRIVASFRIPTHANHLTVIPGPKEWAFLEKGPVRGHKDQDVNSVLFVPTSRIEAASGENLCR